ncbi:DUF4239 domain-containing protein [Herbaspirillum sp. HC18]|nr:DUF4239 domain-containing protein [Herbaspirillum sp. HC18]
MSDTPLDILPLWGLFVAIFLLSLLSEEAGFVLGKYRRGRPHEKEPPVNTMVGATLGLLAFILAFTFGLAATRFDARRQLLLDEANAIGTTYLRAGMLPERRDAIRALLRDYVDTRLNAVETGRIVEGIRRSENLQNQLWEHAVAVAEKNPDSVIVGLFIQALNDVFDIHSNRVTAARNRIPVAIWGALLGISVLSFAAMGYHAGLVGISRSLAVIAVAFTFSAVIWLIADLDRPREGSLRISQQPLIDLRQSMN